ncbi:MAG: deoxyribose-phosphate aldolase, partial [Clostridioides sp.]|nr:deoxyribose-phosphate aldolase [Clostridioides sp.]
DVIGNTIKNSTGNKILKVIIETCYLTKEEIVELCEVIIKSNADFVKTSTGFGTSGANLEDVELIKKCVGDKIKIKASGGIRNYEQGKEFIEAGADRIGTSSIF